MDRPGTLQLLLLLIAGSIAVSFASIFVRLAHAPALSIAAHRMLWATLILAPFSVTGPVRELAALSRKDWIHLSLSGFALALHFALWISSLSHTSVASSVLLVDTTPFFIGIASRFISSRSPGWPFWVGLVISFFGCVVIFHQDWIRSQSAMKGNVLALGGAVAMATYLLVGAHARRKLSLPAYIWPVYGISGIALAAACFASATPLRGFSLSAYLYMFLLGLVPQCVGHTVYNWSLRWLPPALIGLLTLAEPVGAAILAYIILGESLSLSKVLGGAIVLAGIYFATRSLSKDEKKAPSGKGA